MAFRCGVLAQAVGAMPMEAPPPPWAVLAEVADSRPSVCLGRCLHAAHHTAPADIPSPLPLQAPTPPKRLSLPVCTTRLSPFSAEMFHVELRRCNQPARGARPAPTTTACRCCCRGVCSASSARAASRGRCHVRCPASRVRVAYSRGGRGKYCHRDARPATFRWPPHGHCPPITPCRSCRRACNDDRSYHISLARCGIRGQGSEAVSAFAGWWRAFSKPSGFVTTKQDRWWRVIFL